MAVSTTAATFSDYNSRTSGSQQGNGSVQDDQSYASLGKLKKQYLDYLSTKRQEIDEQKEARRYRHGDQYTAEQLEAFRKRRQPAVRYNRVSRKIDGIVGVVERMRQDPKAFPRTPKQEDGADLATAVLRYVLDEQEWKAKSPIVAADGATDGVGGIELLLEQGDHGDPDVGFEIVAPDGFFYDPRSFRADFSDARFMGVGKWMDVEAAKDLFPDKAGELEAALDGAELSSNSDREQKWFSSDQSRVRVVDHWYIHKGEWCWCIYTGSMKLMEGKSFLVDEKKKTFCKYVMFSANVDHDGDRYGFVRNLKSAQDEINARRSKGLHELNTRRIIAEAGAFDDVEVARREAARPDGIVIKNPGLEATFDDAAKAANLQGQLEFLQEAKNEIENFGPNPALIGQGVENQSGRAINLLQQAGLAELGPCILAYRGWKLRVYRALYNAIQRHWSAERWIRVTDDDGLAQFIQINGVGVGPNGFPTMVNAIGSLDVDIILDESADTVTMMQDAYESLIMAQQQGQQVPIQLLIELMPIEGRVKKKWLGLLNQPNPQVQQAQQLELANKAADTEQKKSAAVLNYAKAGEAATPEQPSVEPQKLELPPDVQIGKAVADINATNAKADHTRAQAAKTHQDMMMQPMQFAHEVETANRQLERQD